MCTIGVILLLSPNAVKLFIIILIKFQKVQWIFYVVLISFIRIRESTVQWQSFNDLKSLK